MQRRLQQMLGNEDSQKKTNFVEIQENSHIINLFPIERILTDLDCDYPTMAHVFETHENKQFHKWFSENNMKRFGQVNFIDGLFKSEKGNIGTLTIAKIVPNLRIQNHEPSKIGKPIVLIEIDEKPKRGRQKQNLNIHIHEEDKKNSILTTALRSHTPQKKGKAQKQKEE